MFDDLFSGQDTGDMWETASNWGSSFAEPRGSETVTSNALQSMTPVDGNANGGNWGTFFQGAFSNVLGYALQRDAAKAGLAQQNQAQGQAYAAQAMRVQQQPQGGGLLMLALVAGGIFLAVKAAK